MSLSLIKVLIIEGSSDSAEILTDIINSDPELCVIGFVNHGEAALHFIAYEKPDVIIMDHRIAQMDEFETTRRIMQTHPIPIIIVEASYPKDDFSNSFQAIQAGALEILEKPADRQDPQFSTYSQNMIRTIKIVAGVKLITRQHQTALFNTDIPSPLQMIKSHKTSQNIEAVAIGTSLGGPQALSTIFSLLPADFPVPIFVVQHISTGFTQNFADWLKQYTPLKVEMAVHQKVALPGHIYIAPDRHHLEILQGNIMQLCPCENQEGLCPSVARLFSSMAKNLGSHGIGIILTGMGSDGVEELLLMKQAGALTFAQDQNSSLMFGMPKEAIAIGAASYVLSLENIACFLKSIFRINS